jgi:hypothetical protein
MDPVSIATGYAVVRAGRCPVLVDTTATPPTCDRPITDHLFLAGPVWIEGAAEPGLTEACDRHLALITFGLLTDAVVRFPTETHD